MIPIFKRLTRLIPIDPQKLVLQAKALLHSSPCHPQQRNFLIDHSIPWPSADLRDIGSECVSFGPKFRHFLSTFYAQYMVKCLLFNYPITK